LLLIRNFIIFNFYSHLIKIKAISSNIFNYCSLTQLSICIHLITTINTQTSLCISPMFITRNNIILFLRHLLHIWDTLSIIWLWKLHQDKLVILTLIKLTSRISLYKILFICYCPCNLILYIIQNIGLYPIGIFLVQNWLVMSNPIALILLPVLGIWGNGFYTGVVCMDTGGVVAGAVLVVELITLIVDTNFFKEFTLLLFNFLRG